MQVIQSRLNGFCAGVKMADEKIKSVVKESKDPNEEFYVLGSIIHNKDYQKKLEENFNVKCVDSVLDIPDDATVFIRTHGVKKEWEAKLREKYKKVYDLTCFKVKKAEDLVADFSDKNFFIVIIGKEKHPEVLSLTSYAKDCIVLSNDEEIKIFIEHFPQIAKEKKYKDIAVLTQSTFSENIYKNACNKISTSLKEYNVVCCNTICPITRKKEEDALDILPTVDASFVIGDRNSSNSKKLFDVLNAVHPYVFFIENVEDLKHQSIELSYFYKVQVVSSTSTPDFIREEVVSYLENYKSF